MNVLKLVIFMVLLFEGLRIILLSSYHTKTIGVIMVLLGYFILRKTIPPKGEIKKNRLLPIAGLLVISSDIAYNVFLKKSFEFLGLDWMTIIFGLSLIAYNLIPLRFEREARFLVIFTGIFFLSLSMPIGLLTLKVGSKAAALYMQEFITRPLTILLNLSGIPAYSIYNWVYYAGREGTIQLGIGISCSGAYSFAIFFSAFVSFVQVKYDRFDGKIRYLLIAGLLGTYLANLLRVYLIALAGFYYGRDALIYAHQHFGWIIFMLWVIFFWYFGFKIFFEGKKLKVIFGSDETNANES